MKFCGIIVIVNVIVFILLKIIAKQKNNNNLHRIAENTFCVVNIIVMGIIILLGAYNAN